MNKWLSFLTFLSFVSCQRYYVTVSQQKINSNYLASSIVETPDPRQNHPPRGQELIVSWKLPYKLLQENPLCILKVLYRDYTEATFYHKIKNATGYWKYSLLNEKFEKKEGILTYRTEIVIGEDEKLYREWKHQLWVNLIPNQENSK